MSSLNASRSPFLQRAMISFSTTVRAFRAFTDMEVSMPDSDTQTPRAAEDLRAILCNAPLADPDLLFIPVRYRPTMSRPRRRHFLFATLILVFLAMLLT